MLYTDNEIELLWYSKNIGVVLNDYYIRFNNNSALIEISNYYHVEMNQFFPLLKKFIEILDGAINMNPTGCSDIITSIDHFGYKLKDNLINANEEVGQYITFFSNLFESIEELVDIVNDWNNYEKLNSNDLIQDVIKSNIFQEIYNIIKIIRKNILKAKTPFIDGSGKIFFSDILSNKLIKLEDSINYYHKSFKNFEQTFYENIGKNFEKNKILFEERANDAFLAFQNNLAELKNNYRLEIEPQIKDLTNKLSNNKSELDSLLKDVKLYQDKMTNKAVSEMSAHYFDKANFEKIIYFIITGVSALIIIASVISAYCGIDSYYQQYVSTDSCENIDTNQKQEKNTTAKSVKSYQECINNLTIKREATQKYAFNYLIFRLSFSLLLFLAVIYASRIAMRAYNHWRQSENMYLKLNTLSPFIGSLDKSVRNDVHLSLVPDYFGKDAGMVESSKDLVKDLPTNISNIAIKAIEQAGNTIGNKLGNDKESKNSDSESSTEKNKKKSADDSE